MTWLSWYVADHWINGFVCGMLWMMFGRMIADGILGRERKAGKR